jgi:PAS domain S-box-containing protein
MMPNLIEALPSNSATDVASILDNPEGRLLDRVLRLISYTFNADEAVVLFPERDRQMLGMVEIETEPLVAALGGWERPGLVLDARDDDRLRSLLSGSDLRFAAGVPVKSGDLALAYLLVMSRSPRSLLASPDMNALADFGCVVASLLELRMVASQAMNAEFQARESESRFRSTADSAPLLIWTAGPDAQRSFVNRAWLDFAGCPAGELLGEGWLNLVHPDDRQICQDRWVDAVASRTPFQMEFRLRSGPNGYRWVLSQGLPRFLSNDGFNGFVGSCTDVTHLHFEVAQVAAEAHAVTPGWEVSGALIVALDPAGRIRRLNPAAAATLQLHSQAALHKRIWEVLPQPEDRPAMRDAIHAVASLKHAQTIETIFRDSAGCKLSVRWTLQAKVDHDERIQEILCSGSNTTVERVALESLRRAAAVVESSEDAIYHTNRSGTILTWNAAAERTFGFTEEDIVGQFASLLIPPDCMSEFELLLTRIDAGEGTVKRITTRLHKDGRRVPVAVAASAVRDEGGHVIGKAVMVRDLTAEKQREAELRRKDGLCRALIENAIDLVTVVNAAGVMLFASPSFKDSLGYEPEELVGQNRFDFIHPDDLARARTLFNHTTETPEATLGLRLRYRRKDGSWCNLESRLKNLLDDGELGGVLINARVLDPQH